MAQRKTTAILLVMIVIVLLGTAATTAPETKYKNLKVLPQDISEQRLDSIMDTYCKALKVSCDFCHKPAKDMLTGFPVSNDIDFSADNEMKEEARRMMRMTIDINKNYFHFDTTARPEYLLNVITCNTCHRGNPFPAHE